MANGYIGLVNIGADYHKIGSTAFAVLNHNVNGTVTESTTQVDFVVPLDGYVNTEGATVHIKFVQANNINDKPLYLKVGSDNPHLIVNPNGAKTWAENSVISFTYDGTNWVMNSSQISVDASQLDIPGFGNITKEGKLSNAATTAATGDALVIVDTDDNTGRIAKSSILFDTTKNDYFLSQAGTWAQLNKSAWGLDNVTNHQQVHEVTWNSSNKTITRSKDGTAANVVQFIAGNNITLDAAANTLTITGKAGTVTSITPGDGLVNGATNSTSTAAITESGTISIKQGGVTNNMLAGSIAPEKLADTATIGIGSQSIKVGGSFNTATLLQDLALSSAMHYKGEVAAIPPASGTYIAGDVVTLKDTAKEYVYDGTSWRELGSESSYKLVQTAVSDPTVPINGETTSNSFIATIRQDVQGVITVTKRNVPVTSVAGLTGAITTANLKSQLALNNVTNDAQIKQSIGTTKGDIIYFTSAASPERLEIGEEGQVLTVKNDGTPYWAANQATDDKVKQSPLPQNDANANKEYAILFKNTHSDWVEETAGVKFTSTNDYRITVNPSTGTLTAKNLVGALQASAVKTALGYASNTANSSIIFLHKSGNWKAISVGVGTANNNGNVVTGVSQSAGTKPSFTAGTLATASVSGGILTLVSATANTFSAGEFPELTVTKANVTISAANT